MPPDDIAANWQLLQDPVSQWELLPSFMVGELLFVALAVLALVHATRSGRGHMMVWVGALVAGTANDLIFMALPLVDNFWHSQATVMLTPRMPLYIPCVYISFMYFPTVAARRMGMRSIWATAGLAGLTACLFYAPFDIVGAKLVWWTWHDTDQPIAARILGAPVASSLWVLTFSGAFAGLVHHTLRDVEAVTGGIFAKGLAKLAASSTLLMMLQMTPLQQLDGGTPAYGALLGGIVIYGILLARGWSGRNPAPLGDPDRLLRVGLPLYFLTLVLSGATFDPETHRSTGVHQQVGECYVEAKDITGLTRHHFLCTEDYDEDYLLTCGDPMPVEGARWYTVCGKAHSDFTTWITGLSVLGSTGSLLFLFLLGGGRTREEDPDPQPSAQ